MLRKNVLLILMSLMAVGAWCGITDAATRLAIAMNQRNESRAARFYSMILDIEDDDALDKLCQMGTIVLNRRDNLVLAWVSSEAISCLNSVAGLKRAELCKRQSGRLLKARAVTNVDVLYAGVGEIGSLRGEGVVVGFSDKGFDPGHAAFDNRVKLITNYIDTIGSAERMDGPDKIASWITDDARDGHATHVAGIMAGGEAGGNYRGVAPGATIVASTSILRDAGILAGVEDVIAYAKAQGLPAVVNLSLSSNIGPHDGTDLYCQYLDKCGEDAVIVVAAGNSGEDNLHISHTFTGDNDSIATAVIDKIDWTGMKIMGNADLWSADERGCIMRLKIWDLLDGKYLYSSPWVGQTAEIHQLIVEAANDTEFAKYFNGAFGIAADYSPYSGRAEVLVQYNMTCTESYTNGWARYAVVLEARADDGVSIDLTADDEYTYFRALSSKIAPTQPDSELSVGSTSCGFNTIIVGSSTTASTVPLLDGGSESFNHVEANTVSGYSSYGTLRDGRKLPHVCAPGAYIISALSRPWLKRNPGLWSHISAESPTNAGHYYYATCGTSMATPHVAGIAALWLEADPTLTPAEVREIACATTSNVGIDPENPRTGWGVIDAKAGLEMVIERAGMAVNPIATRPYVAREGNCLQIEDIANQLVRIEVYDMQGRIADKNALPDTPVIVVITTKLERYTIKI